MTVFIGYYAFCMYFSVTMWVIVIFSKENSVECIPESWLTDNSNCYWPPHKGSRLNSAITLCENPEDDWKLFHIRRLNADKVYGKIFFSNFKLPFHGDILGVL